MTVHVYLLCEKLITEVNKFKPRQHFNATLLGATCCVRLATLLRHVATCWVLEAQI